MNNKPQQLYDKQTKQTNQSQSSKQINNIYIENKNKNKNKNKNNKQTNKQTKQANMLQHIFKVDIETAEANLALFKNSMLAITFPLCCLMICLIY
jgi:hypothetical protein